MYEFNFLISKTSPASPYFHELMKNLFEMIVSQIFIRIFLDAVSGNKMKRCLKVFEKNTHIM